MPSDTPLNEAIACMQDTRTDYVLVAKQQRPLGIVTNQMLLETVSFPSSIAQSFITEMTLSATIPSQLVTLKKPELEDTRAIAQKMQQSQTY